MPKTHDKNKIKKTILMLIVAILCGIMAFLEFAKLTLVLDTVRNKWLLKIIQQACGSIAVILLLVSIRVRLFVKVQKWLYILPCLLIAINNFQWWAFFEGKMQIVRTDFIDWLLFTMQCICIGLFEELVFRGVVFSLIASYCSNDRKGFYQTYVISSVLFSLAHLFGGNILQVGYTLLTGGLFAFVLIKTKNILCCAFVHAVYNWFGLLMSNLGAGAIFDVGTCVFMAIIAIIGASIILYSLYKYPEEERIELYTRLGIESPKKSTESVVDEDGIKK